MNNLPEFIGHKIEAVYIETEDTERLKVSLEEEITSFDYGIVFKIKDQFLKVYWECCDDEDISGENQIAELKIKSFTQLEKASEWASLYEVKENIPWLNKSIRNIEKTNSDFLSYLEIHFSESLYCFISNCEFDENESIHPEMDAMILIQDESVIDSYQLK